MTYREDGDRVTLEMTHHDYERLLLLCGYGVGIERAKGMPDLVFWGWIDFINRLNAGNPRFTQYEIPEQFRRPV